MYALHMINNMAITNLDQQVTCHLAADGSSVIQRKAEPMATRPPAQRQAQRKPAIAQQSTQLHQASNITQQVIIVLMPWFIIVLMPWFTSAQQQLRWVTIWSQQTWADNCGLCPFGEGELGHNLIQCGQAEAYLHAKYHLGPSNRLATIHQRYRQTDREDRQTDIGLIAQGEQFYKRSPNKN